MSTLQDVTIKDLKRKLLDMDDKVQTKTDDLLKMIKDKDREIEKLQVQINVIEESVDQINVTEESVDDMDDNSENEEDIELEETSVSPAKLLKTKHPVYIETHLRNIKELEKEVRKLCEGSTCRAVLKLQRGKFGLGECPIRPTANYPAYWKAIYDFNHFLKGEEPIDKKVCLQQINDFRRKLESITTINEVPFSYNNQCAQVDKA